MPDLEISQLPDGSPAHTNDIFPIARTPFGPDSNFSLTVQDILDAIPASPPADKVITGITASGPIPANSLAAFVSGAFVVCDGSTAPVGVCTATTSTSGVAPIQVAGIIQVTGDPSTSINIGDIIGSTSSGEGTPVTTGPYVGICVIGKGSGAGQILVLVAPSFLAGGSGGSPLTNVVLLPGSTGANNYGSGGFTVFGKLGSRILVLNPTTWNFSIIANATGTLGAAVVYRTLKDSLTIVDATTVLYSGSTSLALSAGEHFSDSIALPMDMTHDYYVAVWFNPSGGAATIANFSTPTNVPGVVGGYASGNQTTMTTGGTIPSLSTVECILSQVLALS